MRKLAVLLILTSVFIIPLQGQTIKVQPYLQNATPNSIHILWETNEGEESTVEWGLSESLGDTTSGTSFINNGTARIHDVKLEGLDRFTQYYYQVKTDTAVSGIFSFKTPPFASDNESFRIVAMSDMQRDGNNPNKFSEIIEEGIISYLENEVGGAIPDDLAMVLIPGDLVVTGSNYSQWEQHFFNPAQYLFNQVPVYPVPGNHEQNSIYFFNYFNLPDNGTSGFEEHWWYKDYGNTRIIGLDSNNPFASSDQLTWLENVLANTCSSDSIDFVFAQLHHPYLSELWLPGESNFTGEVVSRLESFSSDCGKPSIHFFGHTHGYSRGQSRDHKHLWVNVATAGGAIDHWGAFPQFDYDEFSVSQDEWGFVSVEVDSEEDPKVTVKRISRGNETTFRDNEITDSLTIRLHPSYVEIPTTIFPVNEIVQPECVILKASEYSDNLINAHGQSQWQVSTNCNDFSDLITESWKNFENIYFNEDTQLGDDLTDEKIIGLMENSDYCWRVRYRDRELNWSDWSEPAAFSTSNSQLTPNLLINPGAEDDLLEWIIVEGAIEALTDGECNGISPHSGDKYFAVGGVCVDGPYGKSIQNINVVAFTDSIDAGNLQANFGGYLSNFSGSDLPEMRLLFLNENGEAIDSTLALSTLNSNWTMLSEWVGIPSETRIIQFELTGTRNAGSDNDSYFDDLFLRVGGEAEDCEEYVVTTDQPDFVIQTLEVIPNPFSTTAAISIPGIQSSQLDIVITNSLGQEIFCPSNFSPNRITIERGNLKAGVYFFVVKNRNSFIGNGKFVVN